MGPLEAQRLPYDEQNPEITVNRVSIWVDRQQAGGAFAYKGFIQKAGIVRPEHVSDMLNSSKFASAVPYTARLRPAMADTRLFKWWKDYCIGEHGGLCGLSGFMSRRLRSMTCIRLIDVIRACIVTLDPSGDVSWVALSYVWGEPQKHALKKDNYTSYHLPGTLKAENVPPTILDAMAVTKEMGEHYLWVDSLCIIQDDEEDKLRYIPSMDIIYGLATFTIINAAVDKVSAGIPGIDGASPRAVQDVFEVNGTWLIVSLDPPHESFHGYLQNSTWNTRGWTYQECLLPRRCLIFTQEQVYWQCLRASFCEDGSWEHSAQEYTAMYRHFLGKSAIYQTSMRSLFGDPSIHWSTIYTMALEQFLHRQLSSESDRMNALAGVLRVLEHSRGQEFFWGMPKSRLELSLAWTGGESLRRNTARQVIAPDGISSPFPSWSWTGWVGSSVAMYVDSVHSITGLLPLRFYRLGRNGDPIPIHNDLDDVMSQFYNDTVADLGDDAKRSPLYPDTYEHVWMDKTKTEITTPDISDGTRSSDVAPALLCFWTSTAILKIHQEPHKSQVGNRNTTISDGKTTIRGFWTWKEPKLEIENGKFIVVGSAVERPSHGGRVLLNLMLVDEDAGGVCYRRFIVTKVLDSSWAKLENLKWEIICLG